MRGVSRNVNSQVEPGEGEIELAGLGQAIWRAKKWIIGATLVSFVGSAAFVTLVKPRYTAEAKALIENQETYFTRPERVGGDSGAVAPDAEAVTSQVQLVTSRDVAREAIKSLNLKGNEEFDPAASGPGLISSVLALVGIHRDVKDLAPEDRIFTAYFDRLNVFPIVKSRVLQIEFSSWDPELSARAANTIADLYVGVQATSKRNNARIAAASLAGLINDLRVRVGDAERKAEEFRATNGLVLGANNLTMNNQQMSDLNGQLTLARTAQADSQAKSRLIRDMLRQGRINEVPDVANNELIRRLSEQRAALRGQIASESRTLLPGHPRIKELNAQLGELENNMKISADKAARTLDNDARIAGSRVENWQAALDQQKKTVGGSSVDDVRARELDREARLLKEQLEASTTKYQDALARQAAESTPSDARIISRAMAPQLPTFPKKMPIVLFATIAAFMLSAGVVLAAELLSGRAYARGASEDQRIEPELEPLAPPAGVEVAREAPLRVENTKDEVVEIVRHDPIKSSLASVAAQISKPARRAGAMRILVTGAEAGVDAAASAVALGRAFASDSRVILVETLSDAAVDGQGPLGLSDLLAGRATFGAVIHRDRGSSLHLLPAGRGEMVVEGCDVVVDALAQTYDYLILLAAPVGEGPNAEMLAPDVDLALVVCAAHDESQLVSACSALRRAGAIDVLAIVEEEPPADPFAEARRAAA